MMNLNHIDLPVVDIPGVRDFFVEHFGFRRIFEREDGLTVLLDESDFALTLSAVIRGEEQRYPSGFHVGFNLQSEVQLRVAHARLVSAGVKIVRPLGDLGGALTFHCVAPGALLVELAWRPQ
jgi:catechol 2,3-dioxygenase-like lactoylglutathione lyase family enzyme